MYCKQTEYTIFADFNNYNEYFAVYKFILQGTFVQRVLDLTKEEAEDFCNQENDTAFFEYRFNQQFVAERNVKVRRIDREVVFDVDEEGNPKLDENGKNIIACYGCRTTMKVRVPLKVWNWSLPPFLLR